MLTIIWIAILFTGANGNWEVFQSHSWTILGPLGTDVGLLGAWINRRRA